VSAWENALGSASHRTLRDSADVVSRLLSALADDSGIGHKIRAALDLGNVLSEHEHAIVQGSFEFPGEVTRSARNAHSALQRFESALDDYHSTALEILFLRSRFPLSLLAAAAGLSGFTLATTEKKRIMK